MTVTKINLNYINRLLTKLYLLQRFFILNINFLIYLIMQHVIKCVYNNTF